MWNWNPTGPRVAAYTNPLYAALSIVPALLGMSAELFFKIVSLAIVAGYVIVIRRARLPKAQEFVLLAVALASPVFYVQLYLGLETASFALLIGWLFSILYRRGQLGRTGFLVAAAVTVSRPEGILFAAVAIGWALVIDRRRRGTSSRPSSTRSPRCPGARAERHPGRRSIPQQPAELPLPQRQPLTRH